MNQDPCLRGSHLFSGDNLEHYNVRYSNGAAYKEENNMATSMEFAFDSIWFITRGNQRWLYRVTVPLDSGTLDWANLRSSAYGNTSNLVSGFDSIDYYSYMSSNKYMTSLCSMEFYGLLIGVDDKGYFLRIQPDITGSYGSIDLDGNGIIDMSTWTPSISVAEPQSGGVVDSASATNSDNTDKYRFIQAQGFLTKHRPCYMVTEAAPSQLNRVTTE